MSMMPLDAWPVSGYPGVSDLVRWARPRAEWSTEVPVAATCVDDHGRIRVLINPEVWGRLDDEARCVVLAHEVAHVVRGDLIVRVEDPARANWAQDLVINRTLDARPVLDRCGLRVPQWDEMLAESLELPAAPTPGWRVIYDAVTPPEGNGGEGGITADTRNDPDGCEGCGTRPGGRDPDPMEILEAAQAASAAGVWRHESRGRVVIPAVDSRMLARLLARIRRVSHAGIRVPTRTYRREGRVPELRGVARVPTIRVLVACDVSGSMTDVVQGLAALAHVRDIDTVWCAFADRIVDVWPRAPRALPQPSGGTLFGPVVEHAERAGVDVLVMVTDGMCADRPRPPRIPTVWITPPDVRVPWPGERITR